MSKQPINLSAFENALKAIQDDGKPDSHPGLTNGSRLKANYSQFLSFYKKYWPSWRYVKIQLLRTLLLNRDNIANDLPNILPCDHIDSRSRTYQEITNGIIASAASEFCQYVEDLCILMQALSKPGYFVKNLTQFSAGKIKNEIFAWEARAKSELSSMLHLPKIAPDNPENDPNVYDHFSRRLEETLDLLCTISTVYKYWYNHYIRYKHGLLLALAPYHESVGEEYIDSHKNSVSGFPVAFDATPLKEIKNKHEFNDLIVLPDLSCEDIKWNTHRLSVEGNLLRLVSPPGDGKDVSIDTFIKAAKLVMQLQETLLYNYYFRCNPTQDDQQHWQCILPNGENYDKFASKQ